MADGDPVFGIWPLPLNLDVEESDGAAHRPS